MTPPTPGWHGTAVATGRIAMGLLGLFAPTYAQRAALLDHHASATTRIWTRFWATRAIALGLGYLTADTHTRGHLIRIGLLVDAADTTFLLAMSTRPHTPKRALGWLATLTMSATAADLAEIQRSATTA